MATRSRALSCSTITFSIPLLIDGFVWFQQLIIKNAGLVPPNTQHSFTNVNIRLRRRRWSMTGQSPWLSFLWIDVVNPLFITCYDSMKITVFFSKFLVSELFSTHLRLTIEIFMSYCSTKVGSIKMQWPLP